MGFHGSLCRQGMGGYLKSVGADSISALFKGGYGIHPYISLLVLGRDPWEYMKVLMFNASQTFMLCCIRWPDMAVINDGLLRQVT